MESSLREGWVEVPDFPRESFKNRVHLLYGLRGESHEAVGVG